MRTKTITCVYECKNCGTIIRAERNIILDKYTEKKLLLPNFKCSCGLPDKKDLVDIKIEDHINQKKKEKEIDKSHN